MAAEQQLWKNGGLSGLHPGPVARALGGNKLQHSKAPQQGQLHGLLWIHS